VRRWKCIVIRCWCSVGLDECRCCGEILEVLMRCTYIFPILLPTQLHHRSLTHILRNPISIQQVPQPVFPMIDSLVVPDPRVLKPRVAQTGAQSTAACVIYSKTWATSLDASCWFTYEGDFT
jgi:hypothetical protein